MNYRTCLLVAAMLTAASATQPLLTQTTKDTGKPTLLKGDRIVIVGNTLAERMQHTGWLETLLHSRFPKHDLVFRNLGFSADEITIRQRSDGFGTPDKHLTTHKADVVFAFFGFNESFAGQPGLDKFKKDLDTYLKHLASQKYNGKSAPRVVLFSPIAHENLNDRHLPNGSENNQRLEQYTQAMAEVAKANNVAFVDLFNPSRQLYATAKQPLTINGVHLNESGDRRVAEVIEKSLFGAASAKREAAYLEKMRQAVLDRNFYWFHRYRTTDGYSTYGGRADLKFVEFQSKRVVTNRQVVQRELEILDAMAANRDKRVWTIAASGGKDDVKVDDRDTPSFFDIETNKPGTLRGGKHLFLSGAAAIQKMTVAKGMKVNLFACEKTFPELINPVQMAFDTKGRLWVATWPSYPHWKPKDQMNDKLLILEDTDGDGKADKSSVFADKLHNPTGFEFYNGGVIVAQAPDLLFLKDTDGDGKADLRQRILHGLDSADTHHTANSFILDPGGALHFQEGVFHRTQVETPYGPERNIDACVWRFEPKTARLERYIAYGFANPHGHIFDRWGQDFVVDGTSSNPYHGTLFAGRIDFPKRHPQPPLLYTQKTRPCPGIEILSSRHFPQANQGNLLVGNVIGFQGLLQYKLSDRGSSFAGSEVEPIVSSSDPNFRPADFEIGPDGAIYFTDWHNPIIGHMQHNLRDPNRDREHGRVYRVTYEGRPLLKPAKIDGEPIGVLLDLLKEPEDRVRYRARIELSGRKSEDVIAALQPWIARLDRKDADFEHHLMEALWVHQFHHVVDETLLKRLLRSKDYRARAAATRVLCAWREQVPNVFELLQAQADDEHPRVRLEAVRTCSFFRDAKAAEVALVALSHPVDPYLTYTLNETVAQLEPFWKPHLAAGKPFAISSPAAANLILGKVSTTELVKMPRNQIVYNAFLVREGVPPQFRLEALEGLAKINKTDALTETFAAIERIDRSSDHHGGHVLHDLAYLLTTRKSEELAAIRPRLHDLAGKARQSLTRQVVYVTLVAVDKSIDKTWESAAKSLTTLRDLVEAVPLIADAKLRQTAYPKVEPLLYKLPAHLADQAKKGTRGRFVRVELPGKKKTLTLAEVEVMSNGVNIARRGKATQSSTANNAVADRAIDGNTSSSFGDGGQTHSKEGDKDPWWEVDLLVERPIDSIRIWNRTDGDLGKRLGGFTLIVREAHGHVTFKRDNNPAPQVSATFHMEGDLGSIIKRAAMIAVASIGGHEKDAFAKLAQFVKDGQERDAAIRAIRRIPRGTWPKEQVRPLIDSLVAFVAKLPAKERAEPSALDALQLGNDLAALLPKKEAAEVRGKLGELGVNVILVRAVPHKMVYDRSRIYVEAGKPAVIVFDNTDLMPHNLIITAPGAMTEIGTAAEAMATDPSAVARHFVPKSKKVLHATKLLQPREIERLYFVAPTKVGEYPYLCTYPGHWRVMYGTLHVVPKLADVPPEELNPPIEIADARPFVKQWTFDELAGELPKSESGRSFQRGKAMFKAATCSQCHRLNDEGVAIGPDFTELPKKLAEKKLSRLDVLREIVEPSKVIDDKYRTWIIETVRGEQITGVIVHQDAKIVRIVTNPLIKPIEIPAGDIDDKRPTKISMMPDGLLVTLNLDEILDLYAYIVTGGDASQPAFRRRDGER
jgi:putative heme-binding domain-containing protein